MRLSLPITITRSRPQRKPFYRRIHALPIAAGGALGALVMFFTDPDRGRRRRAMTLDRTAGFARRTGRPTGRAGRRAAATASGLAIRAWHLPQRPQPVANDQMLTDRIVSQVFRGLDVSPGRVNVDVCDGVATLRGQLDRLEQIRALEHAVEKIPGVRHVESHLHLPETPATP
jgi:hypothetical protein